MWNFNRVLQSLNPSLGSAVNDSDKSLQTNNKNNWSLENDYSFHHQLLL
jgi:hypothetical protein